MGRVVLENLVKTFPAAGKQPGFTAVKGINLEIAAGEFMVLVGPSGCGKSTTLRTIAGLEEITSGTIAIDGRVVNHVLPKDRDIAMVFQNYALYPHMSVYDNLAFGLKLRKTSAAEIDQRVREAAQLLGLETLLERKPRALSGGQRQRVAVGRAIVRRPKVFLFDEPLSNLDAKMRVAMRAEIAKLHARLRATMIYVTHDQTEAMTMGDRICVMNDGRIEQVDAPLQLYHEPRSLFAAGFIGSPPMNFFHGQLERSDGNLVLHGRAAAEFSIAIPDSRAGRLSERVGQPIVLGARPEDLELSVAAAPLQTFAATIDLVEPMGAETFVHLQTGNGPCVVRASAFANVRRGDIVHARLNLERARFFDPATQQALS